MTDPVDADNKPPPSARHDWTIDGVMSMLDKPLNELLFEAQAVTRQTFPGNVTEGAQLLSIKTGACPEDCAYCPQSAHHNADLLPEQLMSTADIVAGAKEAKSNGATRFCMGAAWRSPSYKQVDSVCEAVGKVGHLGMETCVTLGMLTESQAQRLAAAGLDYYNHNLDTSPEFYGEIITTRTYQERLDTLDNCRAAGLSLCAGGIVGMGESRRDRAGLLTQLAALDPHPESVPINLLVRVPGTPLANVEEFDGIELVRTIAAARLMMPRSVVRLSAGRQGMSSELHALCFMAGANSIFLGDRLLTTGNPTGSSDEQMLKSLGLSLADKPLRPVAGVGLKGLTS